MIDFPASETSRPFATYIACARPRDFVAREIRSTCGKSKEIPADSTRVGNFRRATAEDTTSRLLMQMVVNGWPELKKDCYPLLVDYWTYREEISAENGLLFKGHRLIVPEKLTERNRVLQTIHEGRFGFEKMRLRAREAGFWPGITSDLLQAAQSCEVCQTFSRSQQRETLLPHEVPQGP